jgi:hypothetical protein
MLVRIEVEFDDTVMSIVQQDALSYSSSDVCSGAAVLAMARCVGRMIAALGAGGRTSTEVMVEEFHEAVLRSSRSAASGSAHICDGVGCC